MPPQYIGGLGRRQRLVKDFVTKGGTAIFLNHATD